MIHVHRGRLPGKGEVRFSRAPAGPGLEEVHVTLSLREEDAADMAAVYAVALQDLGLDHDSAVFRRVFLPGLNAAGLPPSLLGGKEDPAGPTAVSIVVQPPLPPGRIAMWSHHVAGVRAGDKDWVGAHTVAVHAGGHTLIWTAGLVPRRGGASFEQTWDLFERYTSILAGCDASLKDDAMRTWLFLDAVFENYEGMVRARRAFFRRHGLTGNTHYIASTGIEGRSPVPGRLVCMDALAVKGLGPGSVGFLDAPGRMCPTDRYGVTFERGTRIDFPDHGLVLVSGTASIDAHGHVSHPGDVYMQTRTALENVESVLHEGGACFDDVNMVILYLQKPADAPIAARLVEEACPGVPGVVVHAPVCRPGWLVEIECMAVTGA